MQKRKFGNIFNTSILGLGAMRLPETGDSVDEEKAIELIRYAIDHGINYIDTGYFYHKGASEKIVGKALQDGYREKTMLATKLPLMYNMTGRRDFDSILDMQLKKLKTDHIDFYLFHGIRADLWEPIILRYNLLHKMEKAREQGKIRHIGFSFHGSYDAFVKIVDVYEGWEFCQIQYNYVDTDKQAGIKGLQYAATKGLPVIIMEPLLGGKLADVNESVKAVFDGSAVKKTPVHWALDFVWNHEEVTLLLSGMSSMEQLKENIEYAANAQVNVLSPEEISVLKAAKDAFDKTLLVRCTRCDYCRPCPNGVDIPEVFQNYNRFFQIDRDRFISGSKSLKLSSKGSEQCTGCHVCEAKCPQGISIAKHMSEINENIAI